MDLVVQEEPFICFLSVNAGVSRLPSILKISMPMNGNRSLVATEREGSLPFLGTELLSHAPKIKSKVYIKRSNTGLLLHFQSHVDIKYKCSLVMYRSIPKPLIPPPGKHPAIWLFLKTFGQISRYVASLRSNPPSSRHVKATVETSSAKFSVARNFLFSLSSLHTLNKGIIHDITT